ncbi:MAG: NHL repeat-containing protein [Bacteroidota bacterium]|nr:NHL repeat-containing protein [Bacteroidota bacterium]
MNTPTLATTLLVATVLVFAGSWWLKRAPEGAPPRPPQGLGPTGPAPALVVSTLAGSAPSPTYADGTGLAARFYRLGPLAFDGHGNLYLAEIVTVRKITPAGVVTTLAGAPPEQQRLDNGAGTTTMDVSTDETGSPDYHRNGKGLAARFLGLAGMAAAPDGTVFVSEGNAIRRISPQGEVTTWAGQRGDDEGSYRDGPAQQARFNHPEGLALDGFGNLFVADSHNHVIRQITPAGVVSTLAGKVGDYGGANGRGTAAQFYNPGALVLAPDGALLVADVSNGCIRRVSRQGDVTTWAGTASNTPQGNWPGAEIRFDVIQDLVVAPDGTVYFTDSGYRHTVRRILPDRTEPVSPWAGQVDARGYRDAATSTAARFNFCSSLVLGANGTLYVADDQNGVVRTIDPAGRVGTFVGQPPRSVDGPGALATFDQPSGVALDRAGHLFVADRDQHLIRRVDQAGHVSTFAGQLLEGGSTFDANNGHGFFNPAGVAIGPDGTLYVADEGRHLIQKVSPAGQLSQWAGQPGDAGTNDAGLFGRGRLNYPISVAVAPDGTVYTTDRESRAVRRISPAGRISTFEGGRSLFVSPFSNEAHTSYPTAVAVGPDGAVYVLHGTLRVYPPRGGSYLLAGDFEPGFADGTGAHARFRYPTGLAVDAQGNVFIADRGNHLIRRVSPQGEVTTVAGQVVVPKADGTTSDGYGPDDSFSHGDYRDGPAAQARFNHPNAVAVAPNGTLYVADMDNNCIRVIRTAP